MTNLYPLKFKPILKERVWGGNFLRNNYGKDAPEESLIGESWEISGVEDNISIVSNGYLAGNNLQEIVEVYMGDLVGDEIYDEFGNEFPLLVKLIDAREVLSIQVHPDNDLARERHHAYGKTEMWYILNKEESSRIYTGFKEEINKEEYLKSVSQEKLPELLNIENPEPGDVFFIPAGRVHAIGKGIVLAEIQQTSDITYRIYDWGRKGIDGLPRELHTDLSVDAIDFSVPDSLKTSTEPVKNTEVILADCQFFTTNLLVADKDLLRDYSLTDSFVILLCTDGSCALGWDDDETGLIAGETVLVPAAMEYLNIRPDRECSILEIFISK